MVQPLNQSILQKQCEEYKVKVIDEMASKKIELSQAFTFKVSEIDILVNKANRNNCPYIRIYNGMDNGKPVQFILPVDTKLRPILSSDTVCLSDLPCPPRLNCPDDAILNAEE